MYRMLGWLGVMALPIMAQVKFTHGSDRILVDIDGKPFGALFLGADTMKPYFHPLHSASGKVVTRLYPMETVEGESHDHPHHRGLWFTHGNVNGLDFWSNEVSQRGLPKGKIVLKRIPVLKGGKKSGAFTAVFDWLDPQGTPLLTEQRTMTFYSNPTMRIIDFDATLTAHQKVTFNDTKEGTFAIRLAAGLEEPMPKSLAKPPRTGLMINAEGKKGEKEVWGKRSPWVDYTGELEGEKLGIAIFDHPSNPKHPTYWHSRSYGLFAANIFGERDFYGDKSRNGSMTLDPSGSLRFRYRVVIHPADVNIAEMYREWAQRSGK